MHVLFLNHSSARNPVFEPLALELHDRGVHFSLATLDAGGPILPWCSDRGIEVHPLDTGGMAAAAIVRLRRLVRTLRPDLVHGNLFLPGCVLEAARTLGGPPSVFTRHHDRSHYLLRKPVHIAADKWTARHASLVIAPSEGVRRTLQDEGATRTRVVNHGLDWDALTPHPDAVDRWREKVGPGPILVTAARLDPMKAFPDAFLALRRIRDAGVHARLVVAGDGPPGARGRLEEETRALGIEQQVTFVGWVENIPALLAAADAYLQTSVSESFGLSLLQAAGLGTPIIATATSGAIEILGVDHSLAPPGDVPAVAAQALEVLSGEGAGGARATATAARVRQRFSAHRMAIEHRAAYDAVVGP